VNPNAVERFWSKVSPEPNTGCWIWTGAVNNKGYGVLWVNGRMVLAHRFAYELATGGRHPQGFWCAIGATLRGA
jgi:hypothetical protein